MSRWDSRLSSITISPEILFMETAPRPVSGVQCPCRKWRRNETRSLQHHTRAPIAQEMLIINPSLSRRSIHFFYAREPSPLHLDNLKMLIIFLPGHRSMIPEKLW